MNSYTCILGFCKKSCYFFVTSQLHFQVLGTALFKKHLSGCFRKVLCSPFNSDLLNLLKTEAYSKITFSLNSYVLTLVGAVSSWVSVKGLGHKCCVFKFFFWRPPNSFFRRPLERQENEGTYKKNFCTFFCFHKFVCIQFSISLPSATSVSLRK